MSLDNIQLPPTAIKGLFRKSLVDLKTGKPVEKKTPSASLNILGKNNKGILVVVNNRDAAFLEDEELNFLLGILSACKLNMDDAGILNISKHTGVDYKKISAELNADIILLFGVPANDIQLPLSFPDYQIQRYNNQTYLSAPLLSSLQHDKAEKTKLWNCLKQIFSI